MGFIIATVSKWQGLRDSKGRVSVGNRTYGTDILLNCNRMSEIQAKGSRTKFYYTDNPDDTKDGEQYVEVEDHRTVVLAALSAAYNADYVTLPVFQGNDATKSTTTIYVLSEDVAFATRDSNDAGLSWVTYVDAAKNLKRVLVNNDLEGISGLSLLYDYDGNRYKYVTIGTQYWMIQNLRTTHYANGTAIPETTDTAEWLTDVTGAYCWYENSIKYKEDIGALYNWWAVDNAAGLVYFEDQDGAQSAGWRVPTQADWTALAAAVGGAGTAGGILKEIGIEHWSDTITDTLNNVGALDTYGFRSKGNGNRYLDEQDDDTNDYFINVKNYADYWTSEQVDALTAHSVYTSALDNDFHTYTGEKESGLAVRCVKDVA